MSAVSIVIPGGFSSIAVRSVALLYEPARRLPHMASTEIPFAPLIRFPPGLAGDPLSHLYCMSKAVRRRDAGSGGLCCRAESRRAPRPKDRFSPVHRLAAQLAHKGNR